jgi:arylformamidase
LDADVLVIDTKHLADVPADVTRLLFHTRNSLLWEDSAFRNDFTTISPAAALEIVERGIVCVGIDYLSVGSKETHINLLKAETFIIEGLDFRLVDHSNSDGWFELNCLPLRIKGGGGDGAPARVILREQ